LEHLGQSTVHFSLCDLSLFVLTFVRNSLPLFGDRAEDPNSMGVNIEHEHILIYV